MDTRPAMAGASAALENARGLCFDGELRAFERINSVGEKSGKFRISGPDGGEPAVLTREQCRARKSELKEILIAERVCEMDKTESAVHT